MTLDKRIRDYIAREQLLQRGDAVIVGVSGGADSVCLFLLLNLFAEELGVKTAAVHINHGIRGAAAREDEEFTKELCDACGVPFFSYHYDIPAIAAEKGIGEEEAGRIMRRRAYADCNCKHFDGRALIALGHHKDDVTETLLLSLIRGSGIKGIGGIWPKMCYEIDDYEMKVIRPLLCAGRDEIEEWLRLRGQKWRTDETNKSDSYARNRIRNEIIPLMKRENPRFGEHASHTAEVARNVSDYIELEAARTFESLPCQENAACRDKATKAIPIEALEKLHPAIRDEVVRLWIMNATQLKTDISFNHVRAVAGLTKKSSGARISLPGGGEAVRVYDRIVFKIQNNSIIQSDFGDEGITIIKPDIGESCSLSFGGYEFSFYAREIRPRDASIHEKAFSICVNYDKMVEMCLRFPRQGDVMCISGDGRHKKLTRIFIDEKIPKDERGSLPVLCSGDEIVWLVGVRDCPDFFVDGDTVRVLDCHAERIRQ